jgi:hypothetical protein
MRRICCTTHDTALLNNQRINQEQIFVTNLVTTWDKLKDSRALRKLLQTYTEIALLPPLNKNTSAAVFRLLLAPTEQIRS